MSDQKPTIVVSEVLADLQNGLTRDAIGEKYGLDKTGVKELFLNPSLKNKKTIKVKEPRFVLVDDVTEAQPVAEESSLGESANQEEVQQDIVAEVASIRQEEETVTENPVFEED